jgi:hypothetical protein
MLSPSRRCLYHQLHETDTEPRAGAGEAADAIETVDDRPSYIKRRRNGATVGYQWSHITALLTLNVVAGRTKVVQSVYVRCLSHRKQKQKSI